MESTRGWDLMLAAIGLSLLGAFLSIRTFGLGIDDFDIFLVYGRNLAEGQGLVWNVGEERVEGFTSLLWTLLCALPFVLRLPPTETALVVCVLLTAASLYSMAQALRLSGAGRLVWATLSLTIALPYFFVWHTATLMDTALWTAILGFLILTILADRRRWMVILSIAAALARPESLLVVPLLLGYAAWTHPAGWRAGSRSYVPAMSAFLGTVAALTAWRLGYFGYPLPNTYYAKVSTDLGYEITLGITYVAVWAIREVWPVPMLLLAAQSLARPERRSAALMAAGALIIVFVTALSGGDHFAGDRFVQPAVPLLVGLGAVRLTNVGFLPRGRPPWTALLIGVCTLATLALVRWSRLPHAETMHSHFYVAERGRKIGEALGEAYPSHPLVGHVAVGGIAYTYPGPILDLEGLNWTAMAHSDADRTDRFRDHEAFDERVFWQRPPTMLVPTQVFAHQLDGSRFLCDGDGWWQAYLHFLPGLLVGDRFYQHYGLAIVAEDGDGIPVMAFVDRSWPQAQGAEWLEWNHCRSGPYAVPDPSLRR